MFRSSLLKLKPVKLAPLLITITVMAVVCAVRFWLPDFLGRFERIFYDQRVRTALRFPKPVSTNLAAVFLTDESLRALENGSLGFRYGINWPRHIYGRVLREASTEGAQAVAFDILFAEMRHEHASVPVVGERRLEAVEFLKKIHPAEEPATLTEAGEEVSYIDPDDYFAWQLHRSRRAILAAEQGVLPISLFATNALALGDISADADPDGVLRHVKAFRDYLEWYPGILAAVSNTPIDLANSKVGAKQIQFYTKTGEPVLDDSDKPFILPLNDLGEFDVRPYLESPLPAGESPWRKPFTIRRVWHMGIVLAAQHLGLDLANAGLDPESGRIILRGANGAQRILPVDRDGYFLVNWELTAGDARLLKLPIEGVLRMDLERSAGATNDLRDDLRGKLVVIGSIATGNNMTDRGATPLEKSTFLVSKHWNVANSILSGRFVNRSPFGADVILIILLGALTAFVTWQFRVFIALGGVILLALLYFGFAFYMYVQHRLWLPIVLPVVCLMLVEHVSLVAYRVVFEQAEQRRVKSLFSQVVSPNIVNVLLDLEKLSLGGARREVTVFFADVRGFTELTDSNQEKAEAFVRDRKLSAVEANAYYDEEARETLNTVNFYLALVADMVKKHDGTLDKYIGDCVMAFWGAPTPNVKHALACVRAAIDAQRAIHEVNQQRKGERERLERENRARISAGLTPKPLPPTLALGTGINTGQVTVGLMGSEAHIRNYTVFGREVNLASRLEGVSGHGRIIISETTHQHLLRDDPALAATCVELEPTKPKGFKKPVRIFEVPWLPPGARKEDAGATPPSSTEIISIS